MNAFYARFYVYFALAYVLRRAFLFLRGNDKPIKPPSQYTYPELASKSEAISNNLTGVHKIKKWQFKSEWMFTMFISALTWTLTLPLPSLLVPTPFTRGGGGRPDPPCYLRNHFPYELEILYGIRDIFERLRNVKAVYIGFTWLP